MFKLLCFLLLAQPIELPRPEWRPYPYYDHIYNPATERTVTGTVLYAEHFRPANKWSYAVFVILNVDGETLPVYLGPSWFVARRGWYFNQGDKITVTGSEVTVGDDAILIASHIKRGFDEIQLRDPFGNPLWRSWRRTGY